MTERRRSNRLQRQLTAELAALINGDLDDPRVGSVAVTGVRLSKDVSHARVYIHSLDSLDGKDDHKELLKALDSARGFLRRQLSQRLNHLRRTPELTFSYDTSVDAGMRVEALLERLGSED